MLTLTGDCVFVDRLLPHSKGRLSSPSHGILHLNLSHVVLRHYDRGSVARWSRPIHTKNVLYMKSAILIIVNMAEACFMA